MMTREELYRFYKNTLEELEERDKNGQNFLNDLSGQLFELIFRCRPDIKKYREQLSKPLKKLVTKYARETFQCFNRSSSLAYCKTEITALLNVPTLKSRKESEKELKELIKLIPHADVEYLKKIHWEEYRHQKQHENFILNVFKKMKEVLVEYYEENLMEFDGKYLRLLDGELYYFGAWEFVQEYYEIVKL